MSVYGLKCESNPEFERMYDEFGYGDCDGIEDGLRVKNVEIIKKEKIYTLTCDELKELKCKERAYGSAKTREYIMFCYKNYILKMNIGGVVEFIKDLSDFLNGLDYIPNIYKWNLFEWLNNK